MSVKEIPEETQKNADLATIKEGVYDSMTNFYGRNDLSWIGCLFDHNLRDELNIEKGMIHYLNGRGLDEVEEALEESGIHGVHGDPKALLYTKKLPKGFNLFL